MPQITPHLTKGLSGTVPGGQYEHTGSGNESFGRFRYDKQSKYYPNKRNSICELGRMFVSYIREISRFNDGNFRVNSKHYKHCLSNASWVETITNNKRHGRCTKHINLLDMECCKQRKCGGVDSKYICQRDNSIYCCGLIPEGGCA